MIRQIGMTGTVASFEHVSLSYGGLPVVQDVDIRIATGEFLGIVGPSGSGKTTLLKALIGRLTPSFGTVTLRPGLRVGYVPQVETVDWNFPVTVGEVILMTRTARRWSPRATSVERAEVDAVLDRLGLEGLGDRHIRELSGRAATAGVPRPGAAPNVPICWCSTSRRPGSTCVPATRSSTCSPN